MISREEELSFFTIAERYYLHGYLISFSLRFCSYLWLWAYRHGLLGVVIHKPHFVIIEGRPEGIPESLIEAGVSRPIGYGYTVNDIESDLPIFAYIAFEAVGFYHIVESRLWKQRGQRLTPAILVRWILARWIEVVFLPFEDPHGACAFMLR